MVKLIRGGSFDGSSGVATLSIVPQTIAQQKPFYTTFHVAHRSTNKGTHETEKRVARMSLRDTRLLCKYGCSLGRAPISIRSDATATRRSSPIYFVSTAPILSFVHRARQISLFLSFLTSSIFYSLTFIVPPRYRDGILLISRKIQNIFEAFQIVW